MRIWIVEDEPLAARRLRRMLETCAPDARVEAVLDSLSSTLAWLDEHEGPDLLLLDTELPDGSAFELFEQRAISEPVIFCTAEDEHTIRAFKVHSIDYLLKPITEDALNTAVNKFRALHLTGVPQDGLTRSWPEISRLVEGRPLTHKSRFLVRQGARLYPVAVEEIAFFWAGEERVHLVTRDGEAFVVDLSLEDLEQLLDPSAFFRISRQGLLAHNAIQTVRLDAGRLHAEVSFETEAPLLINRDRASAFRAWFDRP